MEIKSALEQNKLIYELIQINDQLINSQYRPCKSTKSITKYGGCSGKMIMILDINGNFYYHTIADPIICKTNLPEIKKDVDTRCYFIDALQQTRNKCHHTSDGCKHSIASEKSDENNGKMWQIQYQQPDLADSDRNHENSKNKVPISDNQKRAHAQGQTSDNLKNTFAGTDSNKNPGMDNIYGGTSGNLKNTFDGTDYNRNPEMDNIYGGTSGNLKNTFDGTDSNRNPGMGNIDGGISGSLKNTFAGTESNRNPGMENIYGGTSGNLKNTFDGTDYNRNPGTDNINGGQSGNLKNTFGGTDSNRNPGMENIYGGTSGNLKNTFDGTDYNRNPGTDNINGGTSGNLKNTYDGTDYNRNPEMENVDGRTSGYSKNIFAETDSNKYPEMRNIKGGRPGSLKKPFSVTDSYRKLSKNVKKTSHISNSDIVSLAPTVFYTADSVNVTSVEVNPEAGAIKGRTSDSLTNTFAGSDSNRNLGMENIKDGALGNIKNKFAGTDSNKNPIVTDIKGRTSRSSKKSLNLSDSHQSSYKVLNKASYKSYSDMQSIGTAFYTADSINYPSVDKSNEN